MSTQIQFLKSVTRPDSDGQQQFCVTLMPAAGVEVAVGGDLEGTIGWDQLEDVEFLATVFWALQVWEFREVLTMLGEASRKRGLVEAA